MKKTNLVWSVFFALFIGTLSSCSSDNDDNDVSVENVVGLWYCVYQQWTEDGDTWDQTYEPSSAYSICFDEDGSGYMRSGSDELFEIGTHGATKTFLWRMTGNKIYTNVYDGQEYTIKTLNKNTLEMTWVDEDYRITCRFVRQED